MLQGVDLRACKPAVITTERIHISGGLLKKPLAAQFIHVEKDDGNLELFVRLSTRDYWLTTAACGSKTAYSAFIRSSLLKDLRERVEQACKGAFDVKEENEKVDGGSTMWTPWKSSSK